MLDDLLKSVEIQDLLLTSKKQSSLIKGSPRHTILCYFYRQLTQANNAYEALPKNAIYKEERALTTEKKSTLKSFSSKYLPIAFMEELMNEKKYTLVHFRIGNRVFNIDFYKMNNITKKEFDLLFKSIWMWLYIISITPYIYCVNQLELTFAFLPHKKEFTGINANGNTPAQTFDNLHINSALTFVCKPLNKMMIYRKEECFKVFLHESFHCFGLDFSVYDNDHIHDELHRIFNIDGSVELAAYESYTEFWGEIINMAFNAYYNSSDFSSFSLSFESILNIEQQFSQVQVAKILKLTNTTLLNFKNLIQKTHVFEYYILKTVLLMNADKFFDWCLKTNPLFYKIKDNSDFMCFIRDNITDLHRLISKKKVADIYKLLYGGTKERKDKKSKKELLQIDKLRKTMRMTIVDLI